jgi:stearoyl-CoA desaturase (Delta-9 desaturase)
VTDPNIAQDNALVVESDDILYPSTVPFVLVHLGCIGALWTGITLQAIVICMMLYWMRMFAICAGYHRYFSHHAYKTSRAFQFGLACLAQSSAQKSVLWWAAKHRHHHLHSDTKTDIHSPRHKGFFYSHVGWVFVPKNAETNLVKIADFACYPELMWLHKHELVPPTLLALLCLVIGGWPGLVVGFLWSTVLVYHATFCINSLAHVHGRKRYVTGDDSRNNWLLAFFTMGEGWHNNHHAYQSSARQGFNWWEIDPTFYILNALSWIGLVWDLKTPPTAVRRNRHHLGSRVIERAAAQLAGSFDPGIIVSAIASAFPGSGLSAIQENLTKAQHSTSSVLACLHLPHVPTRHDILTRARTMFAETPSMEAIVNRAHAIILDTIWARLNAMPQELIATTPNS